jgi:16S rRNA (uracil1498-N3)-methyltransferase
MLQSRQCWLPLLRRPMPFEEVAREEAAQKVIAHCMEDEPRVPITEALKTGLNALIFIGPEGDFTPAEVTLATAGGAIPVSLGTNRLRTETAALSVITYYYLTNYAV